MRNIKEQIHKCTELVDTHYRIGMRVVKTAAAVMVCLVISMLTGNENIMQISAVSALVTLRATQDETMHTGIFRVLGTIIGGVFGILTVLIGLFLPYYSQGLFVLIIPIMIVLDMFVCNFFKMQDSCSISCVVIIIVASLVKNDADVMETLFFTLFRIRDTLIGVVTASLINAIPVLQGKRLEEAIEERDDA